MHAALLRASKVADGNPFSLFVGACVIFVSKTNLFNFICPLSVLHI